MSEWEREDWRRALQERASKGAWKSFGELLDTPEFRAGLKPEFPEGVDLPPSETSRRGFLQLLGATLALAGVSGCTRAPREKIVPYAEQPPEVTPGVATHYATALTLGGYGQGVLVESHEGRPTKVEGNPKHPSSRGGSGHLEQASVLALYDPSRARGLHHSGRLRGFSSFVDAFGVGQKARPYTGIGQGEGLHLLMEPTSSPLTIAMLARLRSLYPRARVHFHTPLSRASVWGGTKLALGRALDPRHDFAPADVVVALDSDFLSQGPTWLADARAWARRRRVHSGSTPMSRLYVVEGGLTVTGGMADHRLRARRCDVLPIVAALLAELSSSIAGVPADLLALVARLRDGVGAHSAWISSLARDLVAHRGRSVVLAGDGQPAAVHALVAAINVALGNVGAAVDYLPPSIHEAGEESHGLAPLVAALDDKKVDTLVILEGNACYTAPGELELGRRLANANERVYLGLYENETARLCSWFIPAAHALESWGDVRAYDGTVSIVQPLIEPLYGGRTLTEVLAALSGTSRPSAHALVRDRWRAEAPRDFEVFWETALSAGVLEGTAAKPVDVEVDWGSVARVLSTLSPPPAGLEIAFPPDARVRDGAHTNNAWLLELPDPITKLTWENALLMSPQTAGTLKVASGDVVEVSLRGRRVLAPALVVPGHADQTLTLPLGFGRGGGEQLARDVGVDAYALMSASAPYFEVGASVAPQGGRHVLAITQEHWSMEGRDLVRRAALAEYRENPRFARHEEEPPATLYKLPLLSDNQWAMSIDLNACTGCSACVIACQAENNTPIVGKEGVVMNREMHWMRIDRYFEGPVDDPKVSVQPMLCQHCEKAPCEYVCPVNATVHSPDGLNEQVYNRCVGTRFCSNNCAWKVRRFNWFNYHEQQVRNEGSDARELHRMVMNPDVTVRARGVMEKCSFCVQRIRRSEIDARISGVPSKDGDFTTACAQACPTEAIVFGSISRKGSPIATLRNDDRAYAVLGELGTEPRVRYLARVDNPNPDLSPDASHGIPKPQGVGGS